MTRLGLVGGLGPESTIDYYRRILELWAHEKPGSSPSIVIDSLDVQRGIRLVRDDRPGLVEYLLDSIERLAAAGADFGAMAANTPHVVFDELAARSPLPLLSIVECCADSVARLGWQRPALLGTRFTMDAPMYPDVLARHGVHVVVPAERDREWVHDCYINQLLAGDFRDATRAAFVGLIVRLRDEEDIDGVILGGTELPLLLRESTIGGVPLIDSAAVHVAAIVARLRSVTIEAAVQ
ncbi:MAG: aspartate/glutamate racemase family protein [Gemmatimonadaceae bacterium]